MLPYTKFDGYSQVGDNIYFTTGGDIKKAINTEDIASVYLDSNDIAVIRMVTKYSMVFNSVDATNLGFADTQDIVNTFTPLMSGGGSGTPTATADYELETVWLLDDTTGTGSNLVNVRAVYKYDLNTDVKSLVDYYTEDGSTVYVPVGTLALADTFGDEAEMQVNYLVIDGVGNWSPPALCQGVTIIQTAAGTTPATMTTDAGTYDLPVGQKIEYANDSHETLQIEMGTFSVDSTDAGNYILISYTTLN